MKGMFDDVKGGVQGALKYLGIMNDTPCTPKECVTKMQTVCGGGGSATTTAEEDAGKGGLLGMGAYTAGAVITGGVTAGAMIGDLGYHLGKDPKNAVYNSLGDFSGLLSGIAGTTPKTGADYKTQTAAPISSFAQWDPLNATKIGTEWNREMGVIKGAWSNTTSYLGSVWNRFLGQWNNNHIASVWGGLVAYIKGAWNNTVSFVDNGASNIYNAGANAFNGIYNAISGALGNAWVLIQNFVNNSVSDISKVGSSIESAAQSAANNAINSAGGDGTNLYAAGGDGTNLYTGSSSSNSSNVTHNHTWNIGTIGDKATADHVVQQVVNQFTKENDIRGA